MSNALFGCFDQNFTKSVNKGSVFHNCSFITRNQNDNNVSKSQKQQQKYDILAAAVPQNLNKTKNSLAKLYI